ncbi:MAG TPA: DNA polymerase III subunit delta [Gemmatimonadaceae bacterium]|jgi:DNA polymerase-3 subunit delta|nr:DNA polymerase III subunit delta [Gemmatimonadaceae bacterium]
MPPAAMRALKSALEQRNFDRVYLFHGDDDYLKEDKVRALIDRATDAGTRDFNLEIRRAAETDAAALGLALDSLPMMAERRVVILRDVTTLKKDARTVLGKYLGRPAPDTVLVLVAGTGTKPDAELMDAATSVEFKPLSDSDLVKWAVHHASTLGVAIEPGAAELLCGATGNDLALLAGEIDKLRSYTNGQAIDESAIEAIVGVRHGETLADLLDLVAQRKSTSAIALLERVLAQPKTTGVSIVMALTTQTLAIGWLLAARARGLAQHQFERELFALLKENPSSLVGRPWGEGVKAWVHAVKHWDEAAIDRAISLLLAADLSLKDTRISSEEQLLTSLLLAMTAGAARRAAA